jgi:hypothetical protein
MERKNYMNTNNPSSNADPVTIQQGAATAVRSHRIKIRVLTSVAFLFGIVTIAVSVAIVWSYPIFILPKQKQLFDNADAAVKQAKTNTATGLPPSSEDVRQINNLLANEIFMTRVVSIGTSVVAIAVGVLGLGTLVLLTVVVLNRRVTLNQVNASLAQISNQLRELQNTRGSP